MVNENWIWLVKWSHCCEGVKPHSDWVDSEMQFPGVNETQVPLLVICFTFISYFLSNLYLPFQTPNFSNWSKLIYKFYITLIRICFYLLFPKRCDFRPEQRGGPGCSVPRAHPQSGAAGYYGRQCKYHDHTHNLGTAGYYGHQCKYQEHTHNLALLVSMDAN